MNSKEFCFTFRMLSFLDSHAGDAAGLLELRGRSTRRLGSFGLTGSCATYPAAP
ncbi:MAG: hypothetical protein LC776_07590 [Acidobacteria bacterium]|nr:hypothetical protein [Acidobacteriota bacterium]